MLHQTKCGSNIQCTDKWYIFNVQDGFWSEELPGTAWWTNFSGSRPSNWINIIVPLWQKIQVKFLEAVLWMSSCVLQFVIVYHLLYNISIKIVLIVKLHRHFWKINFYTKSNVYTCDCLHFSMDFQLNFVDSFIAKFL